MTLPHLLGRQWNRRGGASLLALVAIASVLPRPTLALVSSTDTWEGGNHSWFNGEYWSYGVNPGPGDNAEISGFGQPSIAKGQAAQANALAIDSGSAVLIDGTGSLTVSQLNGSGHVIGTNFAHITGSIGSLVVSAGVFDGSLNNSITDGSYTGTLQLTKVTGGTLTLTSYGSNYSGGTIIDGGTIQVTNRYALGTGSVTLNGGTLQSGVPYASELRVYNPIIVGSSGGTLDSNGANAMTLLGGISGAGSPGVLKFKNSAGPDGDLFDFLVSSANTSAGGSEIMDGTRLESIANNGLGVGPLQVDASGRFGLSAVSQFVTVLSGAGRIAGNGFRAPGEGLLIVQSGSFSGILKDGTSYEVDGSATYSGTLGLTKQSDGSPAGGTLLLSGLSTYSGGTTIEAGTIQAGSTSALSANSAFAVASGATLDLHGFSNSVAALAGNGLVTNADTSAATLTIGETGGSGSFSGLLADGASPLAIAKAGAGTLTLTGVNSYSGGTAITGGQIVITTNGALGGGPVTFNGGALAAGSTGLVVTNAAVLSGNGTIDSQGYSVTYAGAISGAGALSKVGSGTLTLSGSNSYAGGTTVGAGALVAGSALAVGTGPLAIAGGATFDLHGFSVSTDGLSGAGALTNSGTATATFALASSSDMTYAGVLEDGAGALRLQKSGAGTLTLAAPNGYSGGTLLDGGTLALGSAGALGSGSLTMAPGTTLALLGSFTLVNPIDLLAADPTIDTGPNNVTLAGPISGDGDLTKLGTGTLDLTGTNTYTGATTVAQGTLLVDGSTANSVATVDSGAVIGGRGTIGGLNLLGGGTLAPGAGVPFSTLTIAGNAALQSGSTYAITINAAGQTDRTVVTGTATLGGASLAVTALGSGFSTASHYDILSAGSVAGTFGPITASGSLGLLSPTLSYSATDVTLGFVATAPLASEAATPNQAAVARAIDSLGPGNPLYNAVIGLDAADARQAFEALSGETHASATTSAVQTGRVTSSILFDRLWNLPIPQSGDALDALKQFAPGTPALLNCYAPVTAPATTARPANGGYTVWGQAIGDFGHSGSDGNAAPVDRTLGGFMLGLDSRVDARGLENWRVGVAGGYTDTAFTVKSGGSGSFENAFGSLYAGARYGNVTLRLGGTYGGTQTNARRTVAFPGFFETERSNNGGDTGAVFGEVGYRFTSSMTVVEPIINGAYTHTHQDGYREKGGAAALVGAGQDVDVESTTLGVRGEVLPIQTLPIVARVFIGWLHSYGDINPAATVAFASGGLSFSSYGTPLDRNAVVGEAGLDYRATTALSLGITYFGQAGERTTDNAIKGRIDYRF